MDGSQLKNLEVLCKVLYEGNNEAERAHAQQSVLVLQSSAEYIPQCQYVLDNSGSPYALLVASTSLTKLITTHWNNFTASQRVDIRNYVLGYLAQKGPTMEKFVTTSLIQMVCRLTKFGWFDDEQHREIVNEVTKFLQATVDHCIIGLQILNELVTEMNLPVAGRNIAFHRKIAVSFREESLFRIFQVSLTTLRQLQLHNIVGASQDQERRMGDLALSLAIKCLSFDFIGTNPDESSDETGSIQIPTSWRQVIQDPQTMQLLFDYYTASHEPNSAKCLETLMLFASVRRNLFATDKDRANFLSQLVTGICTILSTQQGLSEQQNYHEFCRLLGRLKSNYQLSELMKVESFQEWMDMTPDFTIKSFHQWQWSANSTHYLLGLWARLVAALPYVRLDARPGSPTSSTFLDNSVPQVIQAYVQSRLESAEQCASDDNLEDPLEDEGGLFEQLEKLPTLCHFNYANTGEYFVSIFDPIIARYAEICGIVEQSGMSGMSDEALQQGVTAMENQMAWLIYVIGSIMGGQAYSAGSTEGDELVDADLSQRVFRAMQLTEHRLISSGGSQRPSTHFELALLSYFSSFRKCYIGEQHGMPSAPTPSSTLQSSSNTSSSTSANTSSPQMNPSSGSPSSSETTVSAKTKAYQRMFERMGFGDHTVVVNMIVTKVGNNLKFWGDDEVVISKTLDLFFEIASGYSSGKLLLGLETVQYLIGHHTAEEFPFLAIPANTRHRTTFHSTIARLLFTTAFDESSERFELFMGPIEEVLANLMRAPSFRQPVAREAVIGVCRDLRGIVQQTHSRRTFSCIFDFLYPTYFPVFVRAAEELFDHPLAMTALLKFLQELAYNKAQRVMFDQSSANGILLFRELSSVVVAYGSRIQQVANANTLTGKNAYAEKYKGVSLCLGILYRALGGNYVNFGVFKLYNDQSLDAALEIALQLVLSIPHEDLMNYPKVKNAYYFFLEILFRNQIASVVALESGIFSQLVQSLHEGINSIDVGTAAQCATAVDHLATLYYHEMKKKRDTPTKHALATHVQNNPTMWTSILSALFDLLVYGDAASQWALSRPILSLTLCNADALTAYQQSLISSQPRENTPLINEAFTSLFSEIMPNLEAANRDKFTQRLGHFRNTLRSFLTIQ